MISPVPIQARSTSYITSNEVEGASEANASMAAVFRLEPFERFVFVMSVLEGYSNQECALLLNCMRQDVVTLRARALQHLALADVRLITPVAPNTEGFKNEQFLSLIGADEDGNFIGSCISTQTTLGFHFESLDERKDRSNVRETR